MASVTLNAIPGQLTTGPAFPVSGVYTPDPTAAPVMEYTDGTVANEVWSRVNAAITLTSSGRVATDTGATGIAVAALATTATTNSLVTSLDNTSLTVPAGTTTLLAFLAHGEQTNAATGVAVHWDSAGTNQNMTLIGTVDSGNFNVKVSLYGLVSPTTGAKTLHATWTGGCPAALSAIALTGTVTTSVAAAFIHAATNTALTGAPSVSVTSSAANMAIAFMALNNAAITSETATNSTLLFNASLTQLGTAAARATGASTVAFTAAPSGSNEWVAAGCDVVAAAASAYHPGFAAPGITSGLLYWETVQTLGSTSAAIGIGNVNSTTASGTRLGSGTDTIGYRTDGSVWNNGSQVATWAAPGTGANVRVCHALDLTNHKYWTRVGPTGNWNNDVIGNQNPATNTGGYTIPSAVYAAAVVPAFQTFASGDTVTGVFDAPSFVGTPPSGFGGASSFVPFPAGSTVPGAVVPASQNFSFQHPTIGSAGTYPITVRDHTSGANATASVVVTGPAGLVTSPDGTTLTSTTGSIVDAHSPTKVTWSLRPTWALLASTSGAITNTGSSSSINTTGADLVVVGVSQWAGANIATLSDSKGNTWTPLTAKTGPGPQAYSRLYYVRGGTFGTSHTFTLTAASAFYASICVLAFAGSSASPFDVQNGAVAASGTSLSTGSITPSLDNELVVSAGAFTNNTTAYNVTLLTKQVDYQYQNTINEGGAIAWAQQNPAAAINPSWSWTTSAEAAATIAAFKIGAGANGLQVYRDGTLDSNTANVQLLLWFGGNMYREEGTSAPFSWYQYTGTGGNPWTAIAGDPRTGTTTPVVTGITLSNATVTAGLPAGTVVGNILVTTSSGAFTGTFQPLTGTDAAKFQIVGSQLQTTQALTTGVYEMGSTFKALTMPLNSVA
jgi:hypothetical protein